MNFSSPNLVHSWVSAPMGGFHQKILFLVLSNASKGPPWLSFLGQKSVTLFCRFHSRGYYKVSTRLSTFHTDALFSLYQSWYRSRLTNIYYLRYLYIYSFLHFIFISKETCFRFTNLLQNTLAMNTFVRFLSEFKIC